MLCKLCFDKKLYTPEKVSTVTAFFDDVFCMMYISATGKSMCTKKGISDYRSEV